jgi:DNA-binding MarR family transcriptional regulator
MAKDKTKGKEKDKESIGSSELLYRLERLGRLLRAESHAGGLNPAQWEALRYLARANRFSNSPIALTAYLDATKGTVSQTVKALERKGLIAKAPRAGEKRSITLSLTGKGNEALKADPLAQMTEALDGLGGKSRRRMAKSADEILTAESTRRKLQSFGTCPSCRFFRESSEQGPFCMAFEQPLTAEDTRRICVAHVPRGAKPSIPAKSS